MKGTGVISLIQATLTKPTRPSQDLYWGGGIRETVCVVYRRCGGERKGDGERKKGMKTEKRKLTNKGEPDR